MSCEHLVVKEWENLVGMIGTLYICNKIGRCDRPDQPYEARPRAEEHS